jgi:hypothetical protein
MKALTTKGAILRCSQNGLVMKNDSRLRYKGVEESAFFITAPEEHRGILFLARSVTTFREEADFNGGLIWLRRWDIGSPQLVRPGWSILENIRRAHGDDRPLEVAPAQLFRQDELVELNAFLIQAIAFGWIADYVPSTRNFFLHLRDNRQICVTTKSDETSNELRKYLQQWHPTDEDPMLKKMASIKRAMRR